MFPWTCSLEEQFLACVYRAGTSVCNHRAAVFLRKVSATLAYSKSQRDSCQGRSRHCGAASVATWRIPQLLSQVVAQLVAQIVSQVLTLPVPQAVAQVMALLLALVACFLCIPGLILHWSTTASYGIIWY